LLFAGGGGVEAPADVGFDAFEGRFSGGNLTRSFRRGAGMRPGMINGEDNGGERSKNESCTQDAAGKRHGEKL
jgi:hypothetical protein